MYTLLKKGDRLPSVAVLQILLNRRHVQTKLVVDGIFGAKTKATVLAFQRSRSLKPDGVVGKKTWPRLIKATSFKILDAVDITDPSVLKTEGADLRAAGGTPILIGYKCNGVGEVMKRILQQGQSLKAWARSLPALPGMSIP